MSVIRQFAVLLVLIALVRAEDESKSKAGPSTKPTAPKALNKVFKGRVLKVKKKRVTIYYDFEDQDQLQDFEEARPPRLLDASENRVSIRGGRLVLEGYFGGHDAGRIAAASCGHGSGCASASRATSAPCSPSPS